MKIFIDSAIISEIKEMNSWGIIDGVTTNPSLIAKAGRKSEELIKEIVQTVEGDISVEVISLESEGMVKEAIEFSKIHKNVVVKIPMTAEGLKAVKILKKAGIRTTVTLVFTANQALLAAKAGAFCVSPFIGRLDEISFNGIDLVRDIKTIFNNYKFDTQILVGSIKSPIDVIESAKIGADIATVPYLILKKLVNHPLTDAGIEKFLKDWEKSH